MARTRGGLNNQACWDYFNNRTFAAQKKMQKRRTAQFKVKLVILQRKAVNVKKCGNIVTRMTVRRCTVYPAAKRLHEY